MSRTILAIAATLALASPAYAQLRLNTSPAPSNPPMVRVPPSSQLGVGMSATGSSPTKSTYPSLIKQNFDPTFADPTMRNPNLRRR